MKYGSRQRVRTNIRHLAPLNGCACAFEEWIYGGQKVPKSHEWAHFWFHGLLLFFFFVPEEHYHLWLWYSLEIFSSYVSLLLLFGPVDPKMDSILIWIYNNDDSDIDYDFSLVVYMLVATELLFAPLESVVIIHIFFVDCLDFYNLYWATKAGG